MNNSGEEMASVAQAATQQQVGGISRDERALRIFCALVQGQKSVNFPRACLHAYLLSDQLASASAMPRHQLAIEMGKYGFNTAG